MTGLGEKKNFLQITQRKKEEKGKEKRKKLDLHDDQ